MPYAHRARLTIGLGALLSLAYLLQTQVGFSKTSLVAALAALLVLGSCAYLVWCAEPRHTFTLAIVIAPLAGNWQEIGIPGQLAPERLLLAAGILTVLLRGPGIRERGPLRLAAVHWLLALTAAYAAASALFAGTLLQKAPGLELIEIFGVLPFLVFTLGPVVFPTARERATLLKGFVGLGAYLSLTTLFEMTGPKALVFPRYILDPSYGIHFGRGRGPFADAVANGFALYACAVACMIGVYLWRSRGWRIFAGVVAVLCLLGTLLTLERSIWISALAASTVALLAAPVTRRLAVPALLSAASVVVVALLLIPGLSAQVTHRANDKQSVWDRQNLEHTALRMIRARPLFGFGWARYRQESAPYLRQSADYPLTAANEELSSYVQAYAVELGLVGLLLWILALLSGIGGALASRGPPDLQAWRLGLLAIFAFFAIMQNFVPPTVFANLCLWMWAGVVWSARYSRETASVA